MSSPDTLAQVAAAVVPQTAVVETTEVIVNKVVTTGDAIAQMGLAQFGLLVLAFLGVIAIFYMGSAFHRIATALESGKGLAAASSKGGVSAPASAPAAPSAPATIHPGMSDDKLAAILAVAAAEALGKNVEVVSFKPVDSKDWTQQGRAALHSHHK